MYAPFKDIHIIINPAAGADEAILNKLNRVFQPYDLKWSVSITNKAWDGMRLARQAVENGADLVAAYGGDGTLMEVAGGMVNSGVPLAYLPGGTGNVMAKELGIPRRLERSAEIIVKPDSKFRTIDIGRIDDRYFVMRASVGFEAKVVAKTSRELKDRFGLLAYGISIMQTLSEPLTAHYQLILDGKVIDTIGASLLIANAGSIGMLNLSLASSIEPDDGLLDVMVINNDPESMLSMAASLIQLDELTASLQHWKAREVTVKAVPRQNVQVDGDLLGKTPFTATVIPKAIHILVPSRPQPYALL